MMDKVAVAVVTYNSAGVVGGLIESLPTGLAGIPFQLLVADNNSSDDTIDVVQALAPDARIIAMGRNAGYAAGLNAAVAAADPHTAILVLNPDVRLGHGCVTALLGALQIPGGGVAVPRLVDGAGTLMTTIRREPSVGRAFGDAIVGARRAGKFRFTGELVTDPRAYRVSSTVDWAEGSTQLISSECWVRCGPWDESFFLYSEETEFDLRVRDQGLEVRFEPNADAVHLKGESRTSPRLWALLTVNRVRLYHRRHGLIRTAFFWLAYVIREASRSVVGHRTSRAALHALLHVSSFRQAPGPEWGSAYRTTSAA